MTTAPRPDAIRQARKDAGQTQRQAAELIYATERAWQSWEQGERPMHPGLWALYQHRITDGPREGLFGPR